MSAIQEQVRLSIEQCIRDHLDQVGDREEAIVGASREIVSSLFRPLPGSVAAEREKKILDAIERIDLTLRIPAAEYVPAISDVFTVIDNLKKEL